MRKKQEAIPQHKIIENAHAGIYVRSTEEIYFPDLHDIYEPHRDTHFLLFVIEKGSVDMQVDFACHRLAGPAVGLIWPGQVHNLVNYDAPFGFTVSFDAPLMPVMLQRALHQVLTRQPFFTIPAELHTQLMQLASMMHQLKKEEPLPFSIPAMHSLLQTILTLLAKETAGSAGTGHVPDTRSAIIEQDFRELLSQRFKEWKKPADYASALAISTSHLNDMVHQVTGYSVSYQIHRVIILEAKRLLYHTPLSVKEISDQLGYEDHGYFSRLFKKITGQTPLTFRQQFRSRA